MSVEKIGRYQIDGELGKGAMGVVYKATDPNIGRTVALKTMRVDVHGLEHDEMVRRFQNEARAAGVLNHPNIVTIYDAGEDNGIFYIAMEYIEGRTLSAVLQQQRSLVASEVVDIGSQICAGLQYAHSKKVIHRDIKPANIMIGPNGSVKIMDFGIAKAGASLTHTGEVVGTPNYMSPEQVKGRELDGRSDLFSAGVMLYEMLTGERPFTGQSVTTIIYKIVHENPIPPRELDVSIHPGLSMIVTKCLSKDPDERYQEASDLATALKSYRLMSAPEPAAYSTMPMNLASSTGTVAKPMQAPPPRTGQIPATKTNPGMRAGTGVQQSAPDDPTLIGELPMAQPVNPAARRNWAIFGIAALVIVMVAGVWKAKRQAPDEPTPQASTQSPAATLPAVPAAPDVNATESTQTPPTPSTPEDRITQAANEIAAKAQKAAMAAQNSAKNVPDPIPLAVGDLRITSTPPGAKVMIEGVSQEYYVTPL
jgi:serine/threonine-protein kinase